MPTSVAAAADAARPIVPVNFARHGPWTAAFVQLDVGAVKEHNLQHAREMILRAARGGKHGSAELVVLPEIFNSPTASSAYRENAEPIPAVAPGQPFLTREQLPSRDLAPTLHMLSEVAEEAGIYLIGGSIPERADDQALLWNTTTVWNPQGELIAKHRKVHLYDVHFEDGFVFEESKSLAPGDSYTVFETPFGTIGTAICFDIRFPQLLAFMMDRHPSLCAYLLPSSFNMTSGPVAWEVLQRVRAMDNQIFVGMCSPAHDPTADYVPYGHSLVCSPSGAVISTPTPPDESEAIVYARIDPELMRRAREALPLYRSQRPDVYGRPGNGLSD